MPKFVCMGASLKCSFGMTPSKLLVTDPTRPLVQNKPQANIMDFVPMKNVLPFGMCRSLANPMVASATAAAMGALTPMPCIPVITAPWMPGGKTMVKMFPALMSNCKLMCMYGGNIQITTPGYTKTATGK